MSVDAVCVLTRQLFHRQRVIGMAQQPPVKAAVCTQLAVLNCWHLPVIITKACLIRNWCPSLFLAWMIQIYGYSGV